MLHAVVIRSEIAHAIIRAVDLSAAATAPGVMLALNGADLLRLLPPVPEGQLSLPSKWTSVIQHKFLSPQQPLLAHDKVRHVGEAIAVIVAESRDQAEDAAELVRADLEELSAVIDPEQALRPDCPVVHDRFHTNMIGDFSVSRGNFDAALARAPHSLRRRFYHHRYAAVPMECRGVVSAYDPRTDAVTIWSSTQVVHWVRREAAALLGMPESRVRCIALDVAKIVPDNARDRLPCAQAGAAGALDRDPARAYDERDAFARPVARCRDRLRRRRPYPRAAR